MKMSVVGDLFVDEESEVQRFYRGANVLVTGGSGFMGKVLVEKLLWSCPGVNKIFLILRNKRGKTTKERVEELTNSQCFDRLRQRSPEFRTKLVAVQGDISEEGLGLSDQDRHLLIEHVTIVFHVAATVRFEEELATAVKLNVRATKDVLALCKMCPRLKAVVHFSSMFSNYPVSNIEERFYDTSVNCDQVLEMVDALSEDVMNSKRNVLVGDLPNTYVLTKALAEQVVKRHGKHLPIAISRPAAVICSNMEPASGWVDNSSGPTGIIAGISAGIFRTLHVDGNAFANLVPCDLAINSAIVAAWEVAESRSISKDVPIYNFKPPVSNRITWQQYFDKYSNASRESPAINSIWYPYCLLTKNRNTSIFLRFLLHTWVACLMDAILQIQGKQPRLRFTYSKLHAYLNLASYVAGRPWSHQEKNVPALWALISDRDKELFPFDMRALDWDSFARRSFLGVRKFLLKEDEKTIPAARIKIKRLFWFHCVSIATASFLLCMTAFSVYQICLYDINIV